jgi:hypothetical protein
MKSTNRPNYEAFESLSAKRADRSDRDEPDFNIVIELDESEMAVVGGGWPPEMLKY